MHRRHRRLLVSSAIALVAGLATAGAAHADVEPEISEVPVGSTATVEFVLEHGCDGSPTTKLEFQVPDGVTDAAPGTKDGWTGAVVDGVVTFTGGPQPDDVETTFPITFTAPATPDEVLHFPLIQTCEAGSTSWISLDEGADEPAPAVRITAPDPDAPTTVPTQPSTTVAETTEPEASGTTDDFPTTTAPASITVPSGTSATSDDDDDASPTGLILAAVAAIAAVAALGVVLARRRAADADPEA